MSLTRLVLSHPFKCFLQEVLTDRRAVYQVFAQAIGTAVRLREMTFGIRDERPCKNGIIDLLLIQWLACDIDSLEPFQFLTGVTLTYIDGQRIVQNLALNILGLIEEVLILIRELERFTQYITFNG